MSSYKMSEIRRIRKPLMEKKRRARINDSLDTLKKILLDNRHNLLKNSEQWRQFSAQQQVQLKTTKLEKADILEMTVNYLRVLHQQLEEGGPSKYRNAGNKPVTSTSGGSVKSGVASKATGMKVNLDDYYVENKENLVPDMKKDLQINTFTRSNRSAFKMIQRRSSLSLTDGISSYNRGAQGHWRPW